MKFRSLALTIALTGMVAVATARPVDWNVRLNEGMVAALPDDAKKHYDEAIYLIDRIAYDEAVMELAQAAAKAPNHPELQFMTMARARNRASVYFSAAAYTPPPDGVTYSSPPHRTAEPFFEIAEQALQRLVAAPGLSPEDRRRIDQESEAMETSRAQMTARDTARLETGTVVIEETRAARRKNLEIKEGGRDPLDPYYAYSLGLKPEDAAKAAEEAAKKDALNPFALLPGEVIKDFLPPPPVQPGAGGPAGFGGGRPSAGPVDEFGNPIGAPVAADPGSEPIDPAFQEEGK
jgi:hypothetical protein